MIPSVVRPLDEDVLFKARAIKALLDAYDQTGEVPLNRDFYSEEIRRVAEETATLSGEITSGLRRMLRERR